MTKLGSAITDAQNLNPAWPHDVPVTVRGDRFLLGNTALSKASPPPEHASTLRVRNYSISDIPPLLRVRGILRLDVPDSLVARRAEILDLPSALPVLRSERPTFVATSRGQPIGFIRFSPRRPDDRWILSSIAASTAVSLPEPVWEALLAHGVKAAGQRGVRRMFARVPVGHPLLTLMRESGWASFAHETVFRAERLTALAREEHSLRLQEVADTWAIHQLYAASVPRQIQEIEALTSHIWHMDQPRKSRRGTRQTGWLMEEGGVLAAYARYTRGPRAGMIDAIVAPGQGERLGALLDGVIAAPSRPRPVYCALRGYLFDLRQQLTDRGFIEIGEQELLIRYTTATNRQPAVENVHFPVELRPALPRQAPTYLEGQPTDGII